MIDDFLQGSFDQAFVKSMLQKAPVTSEELFREADHYITADECARHPPPRLGPWTSCWMNRARLTRRCATPCEIAANSK
ncbi:hypothetical protein, partial [Klebsiella pneumoniae]|uniref:hypothetical protein n=1 Tax=Klebsiella pneumoniae TaxID=573 RepID=UPI0024DE8EDA